MQGPPDKTINIDFSFGLDSDPHGPFGGNTLSITTHKGVSTHKKIAHTFEEEMQQFIRAEYNELISLHPFMEAEGHVWNTYEKWIEYYRCTCGKHGKDGNQPYNGEIRQ